MIPWLPCDKPVLVRVIGDLFKIYVDRCSGMLISSSFFWPVNKWVRPFWYLWTWVAFKPSISFFCCAHRLLGLCMVGAPYDTLAPDDAADGVICSDACKGGPGDGAVGFSCSLDIVDSLMLYFYLRWLTLKHVSFVNTSWYRTHFFFDLWRLFMNIWYFSAERSVSIPNWLSVCILGRTMTGWWVLDNGVCMKAYPVTALPFR